MVKAERVLELERKVDLILRSLNLLIFHESEDLSKDELKELKSRFEDYLKAKDSEFVELKSSVREV